MRNINHLKTRVLGIIFLALATCIIIVLIYHNRPQYYPYASLCEVDVKQIECVYLNGVEPGVGMYKTMNQEGRTLLLEMLNSIGPYNRNTEYSGRYRFPMREYFFQITYIDGHVLQICTEMRPKALLRVNGCGFPVETSDQDILEAIDQLWLSIFIQNDTSLIAE